MVVVREEILKTGFVDLKIKIAGIIQKHRLEIVREDTPYGRVPYLVTKVKDISMKELVRIAEELQLPVKSPTSVAFPPGKMPADFVNL